MPYRPTDEDLRQRKKKWYKDHPEYQDPQSSWSKVLEFFGMDNPYANDASSYDYRKRAWDEYGEKHNPDYGNPDVSWMLPEIPDPVADGTAAVYDGVKDWWGSKTEGDPRDWKERYAGAILNGLDWATFNFGDEAAAAFSSMMPGGKSYDDEYKDAQRIHDRYREWEPDFSPLDLGSGAAGFAGGWGAAMLPFKGAQGAVQGAQRVLGIPGAKTLPGKFVQSSVSAVPAGITDWSAYKLGESEGNLGERAGNISEEDLISGSIFGSIFGGPAGHAWEGAKKGGRKLIDFVKGGKPHTASGVKSVRVIVPKIPKPKPKIPPGQPAGPKKEPPPGVPSSKPKFPDDPSKPQKPSIVPPLRKPPPPVGVRDDIEKAIRDSMKRKKKR